MHNTSIRLFISHTISQSEEEHVKWTGWDCRIELSNSSHFDWAFEGLWRELWDPTWQEEKSNEWWLYLSLSLSLRLRRTFWSGKDVEPSTLIGKGVQISDSLHFTCSLVVSDRDPMRWKDETITRKVDVWSLFHVWSIISLEARWRGSCFENESESTMKMNVNVNVNLCRISTFCYRILFVSLSTVSASMSSISRRNTVT